MNKTLIQDLKIQAQEAWNLHFNECSDSGLWTKLNASIEDIQYLETSWKLRWINTQLENTTEG